MFQVEALPWNVLFVIGAHKHSEFLCQHLLALSMQTEFFAMWGGWYLVCRSRGAHLVYLRWFGKKAGNHFEILATVRFRGSFVIIFSLAISFLSWNHITCLKRSSLSKLIFFFIYFEKADDCNLIGYMITGTEVWSTPWRFKKLEWQCNVG